MVFSNWWEVFCCMILKGPGQSCIPSESIVISSQGTEKCLLRSVLKTVHMLNCLVKRLLGCGFQRFENACFDIFPQRFSSEFQVFNVFHNRLNRPMGRTRFFSRWLWDSGCISFFSAASIGLKPAFAEFHFVAHPVFHRYLFTC